MRELSANELAASPDGKILVDIRRPEEWRTTGVIEGSHLLTFHKEDIAGWLSALTKLASPEDDLVLICRTGTRTGIILDFLYGQTPYQQARHLDGGMLDWIDHDLPVVAADSMTV